MSMFHIGSAFALELIALAAGIALVFWMLEDSRSGARACRGVAYFIVIAAFFSMFCTTYNASRHWAGAKRCQRRCMQMKKKMHYMNGRMMHMKRRMHKINKQMHDMQQPAPEAASVVDNATSQVQDAAQAVVKDGKVMMEHGNGMMN